MWVFVTEGYVGWGPRVRFGSSAELDLLVLRSPGRFRAAGLPEPDTAPRSAQKLAVLATVLLLLTAVAVAGVFAAATEAGRRVCGRRIRPLTAYIWAVYNEPGEPVVLEGGGAGGGKPLGADGGSEGGGVEIEMGGVSANTDPDPDPEPATATNVVTVAAKKANLDL
jgi:hypothetical protein